MAPYEGKATRKRSHLEQSVDTSDRELQASSRGTGDGLLLVLVHTLAAERTLGTLTREPLSSFTRHDVCASRFTNAEM